MIRIPHTLFVLFVATISYVSAALSFKSRHHTTRGIGNKYLYLSIQNTARIEHEANPLTWSNELADAAEAWVQGCSASYASGVLDDGTTYGQNIVSGIGNVPISAAVESFLSDEDSTTLHPPTYNHFTQVVWQNTTQLGCAINTECEGIFSSNRGKETLLACFYSPPGNIIGELAANVHL